MHLHSLARCFHDTQPRRHSRFALLAPTLGRPASRAELTGVWGEVSWKSCQIPITCLGKKNAAFLRGQVPKEMLCVTKVVSSELLVIDGKAKVWLRNWENITSYTSSKPGSATSSLLLMTSFRPQGSAGTTLKCPKQTVGANLRHHHSQEHRLNSVFSLLDQPEGKTR